MNSFTPSCLIITRFRLSNHSISCSIYALLKLPAIVGSTAMHQVVGNRFQKLFVNCFFLISSTFIVSESQISFHFFIFNWPVGVWWWCDGLKMCTICPRLVSYFANVDTMWVMWEENRGVVSLEPISMEILCPQHWRSWKVININKPSRR